MLIFGHDALTRLYAEYILKLRAKNEALWAESEGVLARTHQAEAAVTALRQDLQALPRYNTEIVGDHNSAHVTSYQDEDGEWIKARDLADRLAREEEP